MKISIIYKEEDGWYVGHILEYPEFESQGENLDELKENLLDIYKDIQKGLVPDVTPSKINTFSLTRRSRWSNIPLCYLFNMKPP